MSRKTKLPLADRVARAAQAALAADRFVSAIDILLGLGWLDPGAAERWRRGQIDCLEAAIQANPARVAEAMTLFKAWATAKGLLASPADYVARTPRREKLRFSRSGEAALEIAWRTHWLSPELSPAWRERLAEKASRPPELVVVVPLNREWTCHRCGESGDLLMMQDPARRACAASASTISNFCRRATPWSRGARRQRAPGMPSSCGSAGLAAATNGGACWSSRRP